MNKKAFSIMAVVGLFAAVVAGAYLMLPDPPAGDTDISEVVRQPLPTSAPSSTLPNATHAATPVERAEYTPVPTPTPVSATAPTVTPNPVSGYAIVDTAQRSCFSNNSAIECPGSQEVFYGQDAQYLGNAPSYRDNGDGTVSDLVTGLMWVQDAGTKLTYAQAVAGAGSFRLAGYSDWRVPTIKELYSLMDFRGIDPSAELTSDVGLTPFIDTDYFDFSYGDTNTGARIIDSQWVTSNTYVSTVMNGQQCFFGVNFADGRIKCYPTASRPGHAGYFVRYVRGPAYGVNDLKDNGDGTIMDAATGLIWQQDDSGEGLFWEDALSYCSRLTLTGKTDWRLPNAKELQSIVDYTRSPDTTDSPAISSLFSSTPITNEVGQRDWPFYWTATTHAEQYSYRSAVYVVFGRALGYMEEFGGWVDVHGAGAQRSDDKIGNPADYPAGFGPQGDARRFYNFARCVRGGADRTLDTAMPEQRMMQPQEPAAPSGGPPPEAVDVCAYKQEGSSCSFQSPEGVVSGTCRRAPGQELVCVP